MSVVARFRRQFAHHYGCSELAGRLTGLDASEGCCSVVTHDDRALTVWLRHLAELKEETDGTDYLAMARARGWRGQ